MLRFIPLGGFLGAGKTTTMIAAGRRFHDRGERISVVTNDQGADLVDTQLVNAASFGDVEEVTGGCFCCRFDDLVATVAKLRTDLEPTVVLAEAVGSCTDLQSTVIRPLRALYADELWVSPLSVLVDPIRYAAISQLWDRLDTEPDLAYLYRHQLDEADIIVLNKVDLLDSGEVRRLCEDLQRRFPHAHVAALSATTGEGLDDLLSLWTGHASEGHRPFEVDYKRYGAAEAELAWTNQTFELTASERDFVPAAWVQEFLSHIGETMRARCIVIGHLKIRVATSEGTTKASLTGPPDPSYDDQQWVPVGSGSVTLNARVQVDPDALDVLIAQSVAAADRAARTKSSPRRGNIFRPGFPVPVHRM